MLKINRKLPFLSMIDKQGDKYWRCYVSDNPLSDKPLSDKDTSLKPATIKDLSVKLLTLKSWNSKKTHPSIF